ncbi:FecR family protein [Tunicatimonas pelagia]|uniref:FecR family protein n=1 Tax=Tunicatimonas pelagia TaxID=931531 RepID=UPI0026665303|nr:FecR domain-containing protein [Tunicatimonas pelagia]WKN44935.1 FecR domain-containing protein [Tunicatimonas pelagia]
MPDYERFSVDDFVRDPYFQQWVVRPQDEHHLFWNRWLREHPEQLPTVAQAWEDIQTLNLRSDPKDNADFITVWETLYDNLQATSEGSKASPISTARSPKLRHWLSAAAIAGLAFFTFFYLKIISASDETTFITNAGETQNITLPDGSQVILNANSALSYSAQWQDSAEFSVADRSVKLTGEAFFKVNKRINPRDQPVKFTVHTQDLSISVLGTEFNVKQQEAAVKVVLTEGQVQLHNPAKTVDLTMAPGELVEYSFQTHQASKTEVNPQVYTAWKESRYVFEDMALADVRTLIENIYGKQVTIESDSLKSRQITATIPNTELSVLLAILKETLGIKVIQTEHQIIFRDR